MFVSAPDQWHQANGACGGRSQSPVNIVTKKTVGDKRLTAFQFDNYQQLFRGTIKNNGHSGEGLPPSTPPPRPPQLPHEPFLLQSRWRFLT